ncbi:hypothetical protein CCP3SC1_80034 [Gammaproteobacteria bacterium]
MLLLFAPSDYLTQVATYAVRKEKAPLPPGEGRKARQVATWVIYGAGLAR